jgi:hypothetical protein
MCSVRTVVVVVDDGNDLDIRVYLVVAIDVSKVLQPRHAITTPDVDERKNNSLSIVVG